MSNDKTEAVHAEFKKEAVRRAAQEGSTDKAVCDELGISTRQFRRWRYELEILAKDAFPGKGVSPGDEVTALKRELAKVKKERDFLKEAAEGSIDQCNSYPLPIDCEELSDEANVLGRRTRSGFVHTLISSRAYERVARWPHAVRRS